MRPRPSSPCVRSPRSEYGWGNTSRSRASSRPCSSRSSRSKARRSVKLEPLERRRGTPIPGGSKAQTRSPGAAHRNVAVERGRESDLVDRKYALAAKTRPGREVFWAGLGVQRHGNAQPPMTAQRKDRWSGSITDAAHHDRPLLIVEVVSVGMTWSHSSESLGSRHRCRGERGMSRNG